MAKSVKSNISELKLKRDQAKLKVVAGQIKSMKEYKNLKKEVARSLTLENQKTK